MTSYKQHLLSMTYIALMTAVIAVCSWITVPFGEIPFTMQTFAVFASLLLLGGKKGSISIFLYIVLGIVGLPVFSGMSGGLGVIAGPTGGYIVGFAGVCAVYLLFEKLFADKPYIKIISLTVGLAVLYIFGTAWFAVVYAKGAAGIIYAITVCVLPYIIPDLLKMAIAFGVSKALTPLMHIKA